MKKLWIVVVAIILMSLVVLGFKTVKSFVHQPEAGFLQGQMEARRVMVAGKVPGRVESILVREGDVVQKGDVVAKIASPEIEAKKMQTEGALGAAKANASKAHYGARVEEIAASKAMMDRANEAFLLSKTTFTRIQKLYEEGVIPLQKRDEAETQMKANEAQVAAARALYEQANAGARTEDKAAAAALVKQATGALYEVDAYLDETHVRAPISGEVTLQLVEEGEVVGSGSPIIAITDRKEAWAVFNVREDKLKKLNKGTVLSLKIPALDTSVNMKVFYIASVGDYATWRSSKESGGFDLKTFEVRLRPDDSIPNLRPGMSVLLPLGLLQ